MAYSEDFRKRVIAYVQEGNGKEEAAIIFSVSLSTVYEWLKTPEKTKPLPCGRKGPRKVDVDALKQAVEEKPDSYLAELAEQQSVSPGAILYHLQKLKISRKKKHAVQGTQRRQTSRIRANPSNAYSREPGVCR